MENLHCLFNNFPWDIFLFWLLPLLLLGLLLWWTMNKKIVNLETINAGLQDRIKFLENELDACRKTRISVAVDTGTTTGPGAIIAGAPVVTPTVVPPVKEDLKIVEGIGPKIEELFNKAGIYTFAQLADTPVARMKEILDKAGSRFQIHDPTTWADQAALARDGKWDELKKWQDELYKGRL
jgi:predicted flap endonuclease-1-like 5' DNA nuclease